MPWNGFDKSRFHNGSWSMMAPDLYVLLHWSKKILDQCARTNAAIPVIPLTDTIRQFQQCGSQVLNRSRLFATQTPQGFKAQLLIEAYQALQKRGWQTTDDASIVELWGHSVSPVEGDAGNLKITTQRDLQFAECWLEMKTNSSGT